MKIPGPERSREVDYRLVATVPDEADRAYHLDSSLTLGRAPENDVHLASDGISRLHCVIKLVGERPCLIDQGSTNGSYVNGARVSHAWLAHGDEVRLGDATIRVEVMGSSRRKSSVPPPSSIPMTPLPRPVGHAPSSSHLQLVYKLGALLSSSVDEVTAARAVADLTLEALPVDRALVLAVDPAASPTEHRLLAEAARPGASAPSSPPSSTLLASCLEQNEAIHSFDVTSEEAFSASHSLMQAAIRTVLAAPLRQGESIVGVLYADAPQAAETDALEGAVELFQGIADQASMALSRARLHADVVSTNEELRRQRDRLDDLNRQLDARVREKTALAEAQAAELEARLAELERLQVARDAMARGLVHDIRNLVGSVSANVSFVEGFVAEEPEAIEASQDAHEGTRQILTLAEDVLSVSRIESGAMDLLLQTVVVAQVLEGAVRRHAGRARELGVELSAANSDPGLVVTADSRLLSRVLDNLVGNAIRYAGTKGSVKLSAARTDRSVELVVSDTGPGVDPAERSRIFEEWYSSGDSSGRHHGVGLHFCRLAVESHGGEVRVEDSSGDNSFVVSLPARWDVDDLELTVTARPTVHAG